MPLFAESLYTDVHPSMATPDLEISEPARARRVLVELCMELFEPDEFRRWADRHPLAAKALKVLPGPIASPEQLFHEFGLFAEQHGCVDDLTRDLLQLREQRRAGGGQRVRTGSFHVRTVWHQRCTQCLNLTLAFAAVWLLTRSYPMLDLSKLLRGVESGVFVFLPLSYKHIGFPALICATAACTALLWAVARNATRRS